MSVEIKSAGYPSFRPVPGPKVSVNPRLQNYTLQGSKSYQPQEGQAMQPTPELQAEVERLRDRVKWLTAALWVSGAATVVGIIARIMRGVW